MLPIVTGLTADLEGTWLDLGCGEGRVMRALAGPGRRMFGTDATAALLALASRSGPVVAARLPDLSWVRAAALDGAYAVLVLEHLDPVEQFFAATARAIRPGGRLVLVANHPAFTPPGAGPVVDPEDFEVYWRWGPYFADGSSEEPAGEGTITFHHRSMGRLLSAAAVAGWSLEELVERPASAAALGDFPGDQTHIPRLLGARWRRTS